VIVNDDGLYTHYSHKKPEGTIRILLIGGSTARGMFASSGSTISDVLQRLLREEFPSARIEVVNAGMSGYVLEQLFIYYQLVLSKYSPDMVVGLNGYNDLLSWKINRYSGFYFAPQNMQQFRVIEEGKKDKTFSGRLSHIFPSIFRLANFIKRNISGQSQYDYSQLSESEIERAAADYAAIIQDMHSFCNANKTVYMEFLQPVKWYIKEDEKEGLSRGGARALMDLYGAYEKKISALDYGYSLASLFERENKIFIDDCHVLDVGNEMLAKAILKAIKENWGKLTQNHEKF
jgi:lysophospholipase L1-like esterase